MNSGVILIVIIPLTGAALCLIEKGIPRLRLSVPAASMACLSTLVLLFVLLPEIRNNGVVVYSIGGFKPPVGIELRLDGIGWLGAVVSSLVAISAVIFSVAQRIRDAYFYTLFLVMYSGMIGVAVTDDIFTLFVMIELVGIAAYALITYSGKPEAVLASFKYLVLSSVAIAIYLFGVYAVYRHTGLMSISRLAESRATELMGSRTSALVFAAFVTGIATRAAMVPFHAWLPDAHANAPHGVSAMLSGAMVKVSFIALWRITGLFGNSTHNEILIWIGALSAIGGAVQALAQKDAKRLLAWHTISQMGYIIAAFAAATAFSRMAAGYYVLSHGLFKALLFLAVGATLVYGGRRDVYAAGGFARVSPVLFAVFLIGAFSIAGVPPFNGFVAKKLVMQSVDGPTRSVARFLLQATAVGTTASLIKLSGIFWRREAPAGGVGSGGGSGSDAASGSGDESKGASARGTSGASARRPTGGPISTPQARSRIPFSIVVAPGILGLLCLATGLFPGHLQQLLIQLIPTGNIAGSFVAASTLGAATPSALSPYPVYRGWSIVESFITLLLGVVLYLAVTHRYGKMVLTRIRRMSASLDTATALLVAGFLALGAYGLLAA